MPLFEYACSVHKSFEQLHKSKERPEEVDCIFLDEDFEPCAYKALIQVSAPSIQPDKHWAGTVTHSGKTVFSKSEYEEENRYLVPATEGNVNAVRKKTVELKQERQNKHDSKVEHFLSEQLRRVTIEEEGHSIKQRNKFNKMRHSD